MRGLHARPRRQTFAYLLSLSIHSRHPPGLASPPGQYKHHRPPARGRLLPRKIVVIVRDAARLAIADLGFDFGDGAPDLVAG